MSKTVFKRVRLSYPIVDVVHKEFLLEVDESVDDETLIEIVEGSDLENFGSKVIYHEDSVVDRDYMDIGYEPDPDPHEDWRHRIVVDEVEELDDDELRYYGEHYIRQKNFEEGMKSHKEAEQERPMFYGDDND